MAANSPVVTGIGLIGAPGCGADKIWECIRSGASGLKPMTLFPSPRYGPLLAGEAAHDLVALGAPARSSRSGQLGWLAAREAISSAKIDLTSCADRAGVIMGSSVGGSFGSERFLTALIKNRKNRMGPTRYHECACVVDLIADKFGLCGPGMAISTACSSGALAISTAAEMIQAGEANVVLAGGADSLSRMTWGGFLSLLLIDEAGYRPYDAARAGTSMGEGAGVLVLESEEFAICRGANILARVSGWGATCDAYHSTAPHPEGAGATDAMRAALRRAGLKSTAIDYVNTHGTGTRDNDSAEGKALQTVFDKKMPPISSTKRFFGHALAASGAIEAVVCVQALQHQEIPPNPGFTTPDPAIGISPVVKSYKTPLLHVMSNSFGFGGNNCVLIFSHPDTRPETRAPESRPVVVTGIGLVQPTAIVSREIEPPLPAGKVTVRNCGTLADAALLSPNQRRRLGRITQMALIAARRGHTPDPSQRVAVLLGTGFGCLEEGAAFIENMIANDERSPMPSRFSASVHNAPASQVAIDLGARGMNFAPTAGEISFECALWQGMRQLAADEADVSLVGAVDELNKYPLSIGQRWGFWNAQTIPGEGAMVASLTRLESAGAPLARVTAVRLGRQRQPFDAGREADWLAAIDLTGIEILLTGAKGWSSLEPHYLAVVAALSKRLGRKLEHQTYKESCGEFYSASAIGFSVAVDLVQKEKRGVLLYTLSPSGAKAATCIQPCHGTSS